MIKVYHISYYCYCRQIVAARIDGSVSQDLTMLQMLPSLQPRHLKVSCAIPQLLCHH